MGIAIIAAFDVLAILFGHYRNLIVYIMTDCANVFRVAHMIYVHSSIPRKLINDRAPMFSRLFSAVQTGTPVNCGQRCLISYMHSAINVQTGTPVNCGQLCLISYLQEHIVPTANMLDCYIPGFCENYNLTSKPSYLDHLLDGVVPQDKDNTGTKFIPHESDLSRLAPYNLYLVAETAMFQNHSYARFMKIDQKLVDSDLHSPIIVQPYHSPPSSELDTHDDSNMAEYYMSLRWPFVHELPNFMVKLWHQHLEKHAYDCQITAPTDDNYSNSMTRLVATPRKLPFPFLNLFWV